MARRDLGPDSRDRDEQLEESQLFGGAEAVECLDVLADEMVGVQPRVGRLP